MSNAGDGDSTDHPAVDWHEIPRDPTMPPPSAPPPPYPVQTYGYVVPYGYGVPGRLRPTGTSILLFFCTFGIYMYVYNYKVHDEMKRYSARGIGGGIALLLTFLGQIAMPFVTPAEVGSLYSYRGQRPPVDGWTGLWNLLSQIGAYIGFLVVLVIGAASSDSNDTISTAGAIVIGVGAVACIAIAVAGSTIWFVKTNRALNAYWESVGVTADYRPAPR